VPKVSEEHKAAVRERLLSAAHAALEEKGLEGFTTREVLERAGLSAGTLYHYFNGKDDLLMALAERAAIFDVERLPRQDLLGLVRRLLGPGAKVSALPELRNRARIDPLVRQALGRYDELLVSTFAPLVERQQADGHITADVDAAALIELMEIVFEGVAAHSAASMFVTSHERVAAVVMSLLTSLQPSSSAHKEGALA